MTQITDPQVLADIAFEKEIEEFWRKELAKPQRPIYYLPTAKRNEDYWHTALPID